jgi:uncharacterized OB-fold protein
LGTSLSTEGYNFPLNDLPLFKAFKVAVLASKLPEPGECPDKLKGTTNMNRVNAILSASGLILALSLPSWAQETKQIPTQTITLSGTVATIDHAKRVVNIKKADGSFETVDVPAGVARFDELKVGDKVSATFNNNVSTRLKPPGEAPVDTGSKTTTTGQSGAGAVVQRTMTATITAIDKGASSITFDGPNGWKYSRHIVDPTVFDKVKVGDQVDITWNTDVTISVN